MKKQINNQSVDMTAEEITVLENTRATIAQKLQDIETAKAQKDADALAGNNKLLALGLSQAEVTAMTGYKPE